MPEFGWQKEYGAFTVSRSNVAAVGRSIAAQEEHHRKSARFRTSISTC